MTDVIYGIVQEIIDGDTFDLLVTHRRKENRYYYNRVERIRIAGIDAAEIDSPSGMSQKISLIQKLRGHRIACFVQGRDAYHRLVCKVRIL